jgi:hypothetical protein
VKRRRCKGLGRKGFFKGGGYSKQAKQGAYSKRPPHPSLCLIHNHSCDEVEAGRDCATPASVGVDELLRRRTPEKGFIPSKGSEEARQGAGRWRFLSAGMLLQMQMKLPWPAHNFFQHTSTHTDQITLAHTPRGRRGWAPVLEFPEILSFWVQIININWNVGKPIQSAEIMIARPP